MQQSTVQNNADLPPELCAKTLSLIGFSGLDTLNNAIHKTIWEAFSNYRRTENAPVLYKLFGNAHEFPTIKPKRNSYDWYIPKGILKRNWMNKYLNEIPAVMVIFYDLDWDEGLWNEKMIECASRVQSLRAALEGRNSKIVVVLIQNTIPLPHGEDILAAERAVTLCTTCELSSQSLFVLPHGDHLLGYATRLEMAFYEFSLNFYHGEIKSVRSHKEHLNKNSHQSLLIRHQFKLGFLYELKQDKQTAIKHYGHAYDNLLEVRIVDTNALEIRTIAGFINYKLCRLMFSVNLPRNAISQFKTHIDRFKNRIGFQELSFEHFAWLSKQFSVFGDIFDEAVKLGLPAVQTQHPGIYYQQAAQYAILRKHTCQELCANVLAYPQPDPLEGVNFLEFYGQRPWRPGKLSAEPPDPHLEIRGIQALQFLEKQVPHSNIIVALFGLAISQYKTYRCPRTRRYLVLQMAEEYYNSRDFFKALTLLTHILWDFRPENWWLLLTDILERALRCAFLTANIQDYVLLALEILGKSSTLQLDEKKMIHENLLRILQKTTPIGDQKVQPDILQNAVIQWQPVFTTEPMLFSLDLTNITTCIETKAKFNKNRYEVDQNVAVELYIKYTNYYPMRFAKISVTISSTNFNSEFAVKETNIGFKYDEVKKFVIEFKPNPNDVHKEIRIESVNLVLGDSSTCSFDLKFNSFNTSDQILELVHFKHSADKYDFENIIPAATSLIIPRHSKLSVNFEHATPALLGEWFPIKINIINNENHNVKDLNVIVNFLVDDSNTNNSELSTNLNNSNNKMPLVIKVSNNLKCGSKTSTTIYLRAHKIIENSLDIKFSYTLDVENPVVSTRSEIIIIPVVKPFDLDVKFVSNLMAEISKFYVGEEFGVMPTLRCSSPWPIIIENTCLEFVTPYRSAENNNKKKRLNNLLLRSKEVSAEVFLSVCGESCETNLNMGQYIITWKRQDGLSVKTQLPITGHPCEWIALELSSTLPAHGFVRTPLLISYHLYNRSQQLIQLDINMEASDAFMYAGYKKFTISVLPENKKTIQYNCYSLVAGNVALPTLTLNVTENSAEGCCIKQEQLNLLIGRSIPTHLYVMPQIKGNVPLCEAAKPQKLKMVC